MITIWHNPRCSKSRQALELLRSRGVEPHVIEYLKTTPSVAQISEVLEKLGMSARQLMRKKEAAYRDNGLASEENEQKLIEAMFHNPILIERPVIFNDESAVIGRPPQEALKLV